MDDGVATIFAPASGQGRAAVAIIRISGPSARMVALRLAGRVPEPRQAALVSLKDPANGMPIDSALMLYFQGPQSFTGEDVLEIQHHGGLAVAKALIDTLSAIPDLRPAAPGEFTKRAFLNGKLDLTQAEGLADLIEATTTAQAQVALGQLSGVQGRLYADWRETLLRALAMLEAEIDFAADEEVPESLWSSLAPGLEALANEIRRHLADGHKGERLRRGLVVAVTGAPNVGKSSLVNAMSRRDVAIVTAVPGTTRDVIEVALDLEGLPVTLLDTAGLRSSDDPIEIEGIARALARADAADLRLWVIDDPTDADGTKRGRAPSITVLNKVDLLPAAAPMGDHLAVSAVTGDGIDALLQALAHAARELLPGEDSVLVTRGRHRSGLTDAALALERAVTAGGGRDLGLLAEEVRLAARAIGRVTGAFGVEDILDRVFATFCIGK